MKRSASHILSELAGLARRPAKRVQEGAGLAQARDSVRQMPAWEPTGDPALVIEQGHRKVIGHYQELLRTQAVTPAERVAIEERIAREESLLRQMTQNANAEAA